jgi:hypothetical protein
MIGFAWIAGGLAVLGGRYLLKLSNLSKKIVVEKSVNAKVSERDPFLNLIPTKINLIVNVVIKNPTRTSVTIKHPFVNIFLLKDDQTPFASSDISTKEYVIPKFDKVKLDPITIPVSLKDAALKAPSVIASARKTKTLGIYIQTVSVIDNTIPLEQPDFMEIKL